jgi:hypothetical protein
MHLVLTGQVLWLNLDLEHDLTQLPVQLVDGGKAIAY